MTFDKFMDFKSKPNYFGALPGSSTIKITDYVWNRYELKENLHSLSLLSNYCAPNDTKKCYWSRVLRSKELFAVLPSQVYESKVPILFNKLIDLLKWIADGVIPLRHADYYRQLPCSINDEEQRSKLQSQLDLINTKYNTNIFLEGENDFGDEDNLMDVL